MYAIEDLEDILGLSYDQVRTRIVNLRDSFHQCVERGKRGKFLVSEKGLQLLQKLKDLENEGHSFKTATEVIKRELENPSDNGDKTIPKDSNIDIDLVQELKLKVRYLEGENQRLWNQLKAKDQQIQQLLPGSANKGVLRRMWERIW